MTRTAGIGRELNNFMAGDIVIFKEDLRPSRTIPINSYLVTAVMDGLVHLDMSDGDMDKYAIDEAKKILAIVLPPS